MGVRWRANGQRIRTRFNGFDVVTEVSHDGVTWINTDQSNTQRVSRRQRCAAVQWFSDTYYDEDGRLAELGYATYRIMHIPHERAYHVMEWGRTQDFQWTWFYVHRSPTRDAGEMWLRLTYL